MRNEREPPQRCGLNRSVAPSNAQQRPRRLRTMLRRTDLMPEGSAVTVPVSVRGARRREKTCPFRTPASVAVGAIVSGPAAGGSPADRGGVVETVTRSPAEITLPGLAAFTANVPAWANRRTAVPPAPVTALAPPPLTVAPATGVLVPVPTAPSVR